MKTSKKKILASILNTYSFIGLTVIIIGVLFILSPLYPYIIFSFNNQALAQEQENVETLINDIDNSKQEANPVSNTTLPQIDKSLTKINTLLIPSVGVVGKIHENINSTKGLENGV